MNGIKLDYFVWMMNKIFDDKDLLNSYSVLTQELNYIPFEWTLIMDENRQKDAQDLRYLFGEENGYSEQQICQDLDIVPPSLFEVIVALINRVQDNILFDLNQKLTNQEIFIDILNSLKLNDFKDIDTFVFSSEEKQMEFFNAIYNLYSHNYSYNGEGGLFTVTYPKNDMRDTEIWYQFMWYLDEKLGGKYL